MDKQKKITAAIAAVMNYIASDEEATCMHGMPEDDVDAKAPISLNLWGLSGRQTQMQMRTMMQMKGFHRG